MNWKQSSIGVYVRIRCEEAEAESLLSALRGLQHSSRQEPGNLTFDILRSRDQPSDFLLVEKFVDEAAVAAHRASSHFRSFKEATASLRLALERYAAI